MVGGMDVWYFSIHTLLYNTYKVKSLFIKIMHVKTKEKK